MSAAGATRAWLRRQGESIRSRGRIPRDPVPGRDVVVHRFKKVWAQEPPTPVFVIEGVDGSGKARVMSHLRATVQRSRSWRTGHELDVRIELGPVGVRGREQALAQLRMQLEERSWRRRRRVPVRTPRFDLIGDELADARYRHGLQARDRLGFGLLGWAVGVLASMVGSWLSGNPTPPRSLPPRGPLTRAWARLRVQLGIGASARWAIGRLEQVDATVFVGDRESARIQELERLLSKAMAADLAAAGARSWRRLHRAGVFVAISEVGAQPEPGSWVVDLADDMLHAKAPVVLVISCRTQRVWSERAARHVGVHRTPTLTRSPEVEIHTLGPLSEEARSAILEHYGVPPREWRTLSALSRGHQGVLDMLGVWRGRADGASFEQIRDALADVPPPADGAELDDSWVREVYKRVAPRLEQGLDPALRRHGRACAALRTFDRDLLAKVLGDGFDEAILDELLRTGMVGGPWPRHDLGMRKAYAVIPIARDLWWEDATKDGSAAIWHGRALKHFMELSWSAPTPEIAFAIEAEIHFHRLSLTPELGRRALMEAFFEELRHGRFKNGETLVDIARDLGPQERAWRAEVEALAGRLYVQEGQLRLAEGRFREAKALAADVADRPDLIVRVRQSLASCLRLRGRLVEADRELMALLSHTARHPIAHFQAMWTYSLVKKERGFLEEAHRTASSALAQYEQMPLDDPEWQAAARSLGLVDVTRKRAHLLRHRADIARRRGQYRASMRWIAAAEEAYRGDPEAEAQALLDVVHAHLLRQKGRARAGEDLAERASTVLCSSGMSIRSQVIATRCLAQAQLASGQPERAYDAFSALAELSSSDHPASAAIGNFGLGELARLRGDVTAAIGYYGIASTPASRDTHVFEHLYGELALVDVHREQGQADHAMRMLDLLQRSVSAEHPLLQFWIAVLGARVHRAQERGLRLGKQTRQALAAADHLLDRLGHRDRRHPLRSALSTTRSALEDRRAPQPLLLLLLP